MLFSSQIFLLVFLPLTLGMYHCVARSSQGRLALLTASSLVFYAWWDWRALPLLLVTITFNWAFGRVLVRRKGNSVLLAIGITTNLLLLVFFKYANFLAATVLGLAGETHAHWNIVLPLAISFFTFQQLSYLVDASKGTAPGYSWMEFAGYVAFFPQLIAGPIVRHDELIHQFALKVPRPELAEIAARGLLLFAIGLFKKVALADELADFSDPVFAQALTGSIPPMSSAWTAALAYSLQLYYDFSGYSDMAIGLAGMFGLWLPINFNAPYRALDIRDFWRRWHITLSKFFRDYLYIPLGGNRGGFLRVGATVMATMLLCGLWHGAGWTFVLWGGLHGVAICCNHFWKRFDISLNDSLSWLLTMLFVIVGWVIFRAENFAAVSGMMRGLVGLGPVSIIGSADGIALILAAGALSVFGPVSHQWVAEKARASRGLAVGTGVLLMTLVLRVGEGRSLDFIYFQF
jgi:alginate O-acetyltransferase complex protein AlgI